MGAFFRWAGDNKVLGIGGQWLSGSPSKGSRLKIIPLRIIVTFMSETFHRDKRRYNFQF